jgi:radical SAM superfamily enzyme YgiQ (UPF0313 family)
MIEKIRVGQVQVGDNFGNQYYLPYSLGILQAYAQSKLKNPEAFEFLLPVYKRGEITKIVDRLEVCPIVLFSTYLWNFQFSLEIAKQLKKRNSDCVIVFGGPQVPENEHRLRRFLLDNVSVDIGCYGEGEPALLSTLEYYQNRSSWENIPTIGFLKEDGSYVQTKAAERIKDLNEIPSPYTAGIFEPLMEANSEENWSASFETNRGCPFSCAFCAYGVGGKKKVFKFDVERAYSEIDWFSKNKIEFIFCCDANFGMFPRDREIAEKVAKNKRKCGYPMLFSVQNTKNSSKKVISLQKILDESSLQKGVNLALQSLNEKTLASINRSNIKGSVFQELQEELTRQGIPTFSDMILGLPNESYETFTKGVSKIISAGQHNRIQFINLTILENTKMADEEYIRKYGLILQNSAIISHHTNIEPNDVLETQNLVIGSETMPREDWNRTRVFCWLTSLLHFNKILQIPLIIINGELGVSYKDLIELFLNATVEESPVIYGMVQNLKVIAEGTQNGKGEFVPSRKWLNLWWPADEYLFIRMIFNDELNAFYEEAELLFISYLEKKGESFPREILKEAILLNRSLIKIPDFSDDKIITLKYSIPDYYKRVRQGQKVELESESKTYTIKRSGDVWKDQDDWLRNVVWYGTKKGDFLYSFEES